MIQLHISPSPYHKISKVSATKTKPIPRENIFWNGLNVQQSTFRFEILQSRQSALLIKKFQSRQSAVLIQKLQSRQSALLTK